MKKRMHSYNLIRSFVTGQKRCMSSIDTLVLESKILRLQIGNYFAFGKPFWMKRQGLSSRHPKHHLEALRSV